MTQPKVAIIGGTGVYSQSHLEGAKELLVDTRFGTALLLHGFIKGREVYFLTRHGPGHAVPPHLVNYRANIAALRKLGVNAVIATAAVGSLRREITPGSRVVIDQFIDFTRGRPSTFFEGEGGRVVHTDMTDPYCPDLRAAIVSAGNSLGQELVEGGCYLCTEGPRFETPAEITMFASWGADVVGMTNVPEVVLAREAALCYATIALVTNYAAGIAPSFLTHLEVLEEMARGKASLDMLLAACVEAIGDERDCRCRKTGGSFWPWEEGGSGGTP